MNSTSKTLTTILNNKLQSQATNKRNASRYLIYDHEHRLLFHNTTPMQAYSNRVGSCVVENKFERSAVSKKSAGWLSRRKLLHVGAKPLLLRHFWLLL